MIIAVDFDGTIVEHRYPRIGEEIPFAVDTLKLLQQEKHRLILWSVREGALLDEAVEWCKSRGLEFYAVNKDYPEEQKGHQGPGQCRREDAQREPAQKRHGRHEAQHGDEGTAADRAVHAIGRAGALGQRH